MLSSGIYKPDPTSQETHYLSATEPSRLKLCKIWGFHGCDYEECRLLRLSLAALERIEVSDEPSTSIIGVTRIGDLGTTLAVTTNRRTLRRSTIINTNINISSSLHPVAFVVRVSELISDVTEKPSSSCSRLNYTKNRASEFVRDVLMQAAISVIAVRTPNLM
jgi:hypothetical protein